MIVQANVGVDEGGCICVPRGLRENAGSGTMTERSCLDPASIHAATRYAVEAGFGDTLSVGRGFAVVLAQMGLMRSRRSRWW